MNTKQSCNTNLKNQSSKESDRYTLSSAWIILLDISGENLEENKSFNLILDQFFLCCLNIIKSSFQNTKKIVPFSRPNSGKDDWFSIF